MPLPFSLLQFCRHACSEYASLQILDPRNLLENEKILIVKYLIGEQQRSSIRDTQNTSSIQHFDMI